MRYVVAAAFLVVLVLTARVAPAQSVVPGCLQPDRGVVRVVPGFQACQPAEVAVALRVRLAPVTIQVPPAPTGRQALPQQAAGPDAAMVAFFTAERSAAPLGVVAHPAAAGLAVPGRRTVATVGAWRNW